MKLTLIQQSRVHFLTLPQEITGQYIMTFTRQDRCEEALLIIRPEKGAWLAESGMNACFTVNGKNYRTCVIDRQGICISVYIKATGESALLVSEDDSADMTRFHKYSVKGSVVIGRDPDCDIILSNGIAQPYCAELTADDKQMSIRSLAEGSLVFVNGERETERDLRPGDVVYTSGFSFVCGHMIIAADKAPLMAIRQGGSIAPYLLPPEETGGLPHYFDDIKSKKYIYVAPRFIRQPEGGEIKVSAPPPVHDANSQPAVLSLGPAFTMGMASAATGTFALLNGMSRGAELLTLAPTLVMTGSMVASSLLWPVISKSYTKQRSKKDERRRKAVYLRYLQGVQEKIADGMNNQLQTLRDNNPDINQLTDRIRLSASSLWERSERDGDFLSVCVGYGNIPYDCTIKADLPDMEVNPDILYEEMRRVVSREFTLADAPVTLNLRSDYICGISGDRMKAVSLAHGIILQLAALYSYKDVKLAVIYDKAEKHLWSGVRWLPHTWDDKREARYIASDIEELNALSGALEAELAEADELKKGGKSASEASGRHYVIICASLTLASRTGLLPHIIQKGRYANFTFIAVYPESRLLPKESTAVMRFCGEKETYDRTGDNEHCLMLRRQSSELEMLKPITIQPQEFAENAVSLADKRLGAEESGYDMPDMLTFLDMYGVKTTEELNCLQRWQKHSSVRSLAAPLGVDSRGDLFYLDLHQKAHGPHGLIAGTTGSGKSEFIMTMILSLAVNFSPHDISFLLIDYKGGGMAAAFDKLPHVAGIITNLDGAAVNRSLISIQSELKRRQALFLEEGKRLGTIIGDIYKYQRLCKEGRISRPLQHLFIISDEFAELKNQQPEFMSELISAARIGRSLGVHLILATQKPSGVVNDQIWSNSRFKICLKVQERADSMDVIRCPDAAAITQTGRFYLQVGYNEIFEQGQSAWAGAKYEPASDKNAQVNDSIEIIDNAGRVIMQAENEKRLNAEKQKTAADTAEKETQIQIITKYIMELCQRENMAADKLWLDPIPAKIYTEELEKKYGFVPEDGVLSVAVGEYDIPQRQEQRLLKLSPQNGNILVYGSAGSGKEQFLNAYIYGMLSRYSAERTAFYIVDCDSDTLKAFSGYDAVGAVCTAGERDKISNLFSYLMLEMARRKDILSEQNGDFAGYFRTHSDMPAIQLVIANIGAFSENLDYDEQLEAIAKDGSKLGIYVVASQLNSSVIHRLAQNFSQIFCMQLNNGAYSDVLSSVGRMVPAKVRGRGLLRDEFVSEFQTAYITDREDVSAFIRGQAEEIGKRFGGVKAKRINVLPEIFTPAEAKGLSTDQVHPVIALLRRSTDPAALDLSARMNIILSQKGGIGTVADAVCAVAASGHRAFVFDADGELDRDACGGEYYTGDNIADGIKTLFDLARERNLYAKKTADAGNTVDFTGDMMVCAFSGLTSLLSKYHTLAEDERIAEDARIIAAQQSENADNIVPVMAMRDLERMLVLLLTGGAHDFGISFLLFECADKLLECRQEKWFTQHIRLKNYCWIGGGLGMESSLPHQPLNDIRTDFGEDMGYYVRGGKAQMVRFVSTRTED